VRRFTEIPISTAKANPKYLENYLYCNPQRHYQGNPPFELSIEGTFSKFCDFQIKE
jgi:hypothetical protein